MRTSCSSTARRRETFVRPCTDPLPGSRCQTTFCRCTTYLRPATDVDHIKHGSTRAIDPSYALSVFAYRQQVDSKSPSYMQGRLSSDPSPVMISYVRNSCCEMGSGSGAHLHVLHDEPCLLTVHVLTQERNNVPVSAGLEDGYLPLKSLLRSGVSS